MFRSFGTTVRKIITTPLLILILMNQLNSAPTSKEIEISGFFFHDYAQNGKNLNKAEVLDLLRTTQSPRIVSRLETSRFFGDMGEGLTYLWFLTLVAGIGLSQTEAGTPVIATSVISLILIFPSFWLSDFFFAKSVSAYNDIIVKPAPAAILKREVTNKEPSIHITAGVQRF